MADLGRLRLSPEQVAQLSTLLDDHGVRTLHLKTARGPLMVRLAPEHELPGTTADPVAHPAATVMAQTAGEFLTAHPEQRVPPKRPGEHVMPGELLGYVRVGILLTPVVLDTARDATLTAILAGHGTPVEFGTPLFTVVLR